MLSYSTSIRRQGIYNNVVVFVLPDKVSFTGVILSIHLLYKNCGKFYLDVKIRYFDGMLKVLRIQHLNFEDRHILR